MFEQPRVAAPGFQSSHLGGAHIKGPWAAPECSRTSAWLAVGLQQGDRYAFMGQQRRGGKTGDSAADHDHAGRVQGRCCDQAMLATAPDSLRMDARLRQVLTGTDGPLEGATIVSSDPVGGGCIHQAWRLRLSDGQQLFAKSGVREALDLFEVEAEALEALHLYADADLLVVPRPLALLATQDAAVLLLPWLDLGGVDQTSLGRGLALLHQRSAQASTGGFGWGRDGYIGAGPQPGGWRASWGTCFVELRLKPQLELAVERGLISAGTDQLMQRLEDLLNGLEVKPSLVHGDLWGGNAGVLQDGRATIYDPASWWADPEVDLAMTCMFGGFSDAFRRGYRSVCTRRAGAEDRVEIYNLYHLLNHANLFGGSYCKQSEASLKRLARELT